MNLDIFGDSKFLSKIDKHFRSYKKVSLEVLEGVYENQDLFDIFAFYATYMSTSFEKIAHLKEDRIVVFVQQLNIYGLITKAGYREFCACLVEKKSDPGIYQLILTNEKQKVVLLCDNSIKSEVESKFCRVLNDMYHIMPGKNMCEIMIRNKYVEIQKVYLDVIENITEQPINYDKVPKIKNNECKELLKSSTKFHFILADRIVNISTTSTTNSCRLDTETAKILVGNADKIYYRPDTIDNLPTEVGELKKLLPDMKITMMFDY